MNLGFMAIGQIVCLVAVFVIAIVFSALTKKQAIAASNRRECYKALLSGKLMIGLIIVAAYLLIFGVVSLVYSASAPSSNYSYALKYIENYISTGAGNIEAYYDAILTISTPIAGLWSYVFLLVAAIIGLVAGKKGTKPLIIVSCVFTALFFLEYGSVLCLNGYQDILYGIQLSNSGAAEQYIMIRMLAGCFYLVASVFLLVSTITFAIKIKACVTSRKPVFKGITSVGILLGVAVLPTVIAFFAFFITLMYGLLDGTLDSNTSTLLITYAITLVTTALTGLSVALPIMKILRTGSNFVDNEPDEVPQNNEEEKSESSNDKPQDKPVEPVVQPETKPAASVVSAPAPKAPGIAAPSIIWKEKKDKNGNPIDAQAKPIEQFNTNRGLIKFFFLSIITIGIYGLVVMCKVTKELGKCREGHGKDKPFPFFAVLVLTPFTLGILPLVWGHKFTRRLKEECEYRGIDSPVQVWQYWVFFLLLCELLFFPFFFTAKVFIASNAINAHHNKYGDKKIKVVVGAPQPKITEPLKPIQEAVEKVTESIPTPAVPVPPSPAEVKEAVDSVVKPQPAEQPKSDPMEKLKKAKEMLDAGLITQEEYDAVKAKALSEL